MARHSGQGSRFAAHRRTATLRQLLAVEAIGYLVPRSDFTGLVHSVFAQSCNWVCNDTLLTLCIHRAGDGPTSLRLRPGAADDLRLVFNVGEPVSARRNRVRSGLAELGLSCVSVWQPAAPERLLCPEQVAANLHFAGVPLAQHRRAQSSIVDGAGAPVVAALQKACQALVLEAAEQQIDRLVGWGEGLTPAGDDFLVGLMAGLDARVPSHAARRFRAGIAAACLARLERTTAISAHYLRLAAGSHYGEPLIALRNALIGDDRSSAVEATLRRALAVGATSGADAVSGLLAGLAAWFAQPVPTATMA